MRLETMTLSLRAAVVLLSAVYAAPIGAHASARQGGQDAQSAAPQPDSQTQSQSTPQNRAATAPEDRYAHCLDLASTSPDKAIDTALAWQAEDGGVPARHCEAIALSVAGEHAEAAIRLEGLVEDMRIGRGMPVIGGKRITASASMLADMFSQAANAWLLGGYPGRASDAVQSAISLVDEDTVQWVNLLIDRARIAAADEDFIQAQNDLNRVLRHDPRRKDILVLLAAAERALGNLTSAQDTVNLYLESFPDDPVAHLERAHILDQLGLNAEANKAYAQVILLAGEDSELATLARANIERLALKAGEGTEKD